MSDNGSQQPEVDAANDEGKEDVFALTGTTFAGDTSTPQMTDTRPQTGWVPIASMTPLQEGGDCGSVLSTARHNRLLIEAELRAEHQAAARTTMLDLAQALDQSNAERRQLAAKLREQFDASAHLRRKCSELQAELDRVLDAEEQRQAQKLLDKALASGNNVIFNMLLEKSRDAYQTSAFGADGSNAPTSLGDLFANSVGDKVTMKWVVKLWWQEVLKKREAAEQDRLERERRAKEEADRKAIEDAKKAALEKVAKMVEDLKMRLEHALKTIEEHEKRQKDMEKELQDAKKKNAQDAADAQAREDELKAENTRLNNELEKARRLQDELQRKYDITAEELRQAHDVFARERAQLQNTIRNITSQLHEALVLAKHMRETALKAKRDAAGSVSPSKFAELIAQLEEMKNQLSVLTKDNNNEKENNAWLLRQLDKNKRQLELERQFLPLLRKVKGPIGPKSKGVQEEGAKKKEAVQAGQQVPPVEASPNKLRQSLSLSAISAPGGSTLGGGGPLAGGKQSGGFQDDLNRFSSSLGFVNN